MQRTPRSLVIVVLCTMPLMFLQSGCGGSSQPSSSGRIVASVESIRPGDTVKFSMESARGITGRWAIVDPGSYGAIDQDGRLSTPQTTPSANKVTVAYVAGATTLTHSITVLNPIPVLNRPQPTVVQRSTSQIVLDGQNFIAGSTVFINGEAAPTTFISSSRLSAQIRLPASAKSLTILIRNPDPGASDSASIVVPYVDVDPTVSPSILSGGEVSITISGPGYPADAVVSLDGRPMKITARSDSSLAASGYLPPWHTGSASLVISSSPSGSIFANITLPIRSTAVSFDAAARFLMQAGFGPRPDLVQHVQEVGFESFIAEQMAIAPQLYSVAGMGNVDIMNRSIYGTNPLRLRVAWALQSFLVRSGIFLQHSNFPFEEKMEKDASRNFRDVLTDISSDVSMGMYLNLAGNAASSDPTIHPNQNFARELLQLFTIGSNRLNDDGTLQIASTGQPIPAYGQDTILDLSRALTGWNYSAPIDPQYTMFGVDWSAPLISNETQHDHGQKVLFGDVTLPAGSSAEQDRTAALDAIFQHPNLPPFLSRILIQRMVKSNPSPSYIQRVSKVFKDNGRGVRGDMPAIVQAILLDEEARSGDQRPSPTDGFLQEPYLFETFLTTIIGARTTDAQSIYLPCTLSQCIFYPPNVFGFYSPSYVIPGTTVNSPEFQIFNNMTLINRSQLLWSIVSDRQGGFTPGDSAWLTTHFTEIPDLVDALNHLAYHGTMTQEEQTYIVQSAMALQNTSPALARQTAIFLALNDDNYTVVR